MKNLLTHISPSKDFCNDEHKMSAKIQIDNSIELGWKREDILLATNFDYEYNGVKSIVIGDESYCSHHWPATKIYTIVHLFKAGLIKPDLYWYHDFDCFQLAPFADIETDMASVDMGLTNYGRMPRLCSASMFFRETAGDIFDRLKEKIDKSRTNEEDGIMRMINNNVETLGKRIEKLNITYAFHKFNLWHCYNRAAKPIKAVHFHLTPDKFDFYVRGNNPMNMVLIPERLIEIFKKHGYDGKEAIKDLSDLEIRRRRRIWQPFMEKYNCKKVCEIGVWKGENFRNFIAHKPEVAIAVDSWINDGVISRNDSGSTQEELDKIYNQFKSEMKDKTFVQIIKKYSTDAVKAFPDNYFDIIYIDADHTYSACLRDIIDWYPKVKKGGFLTGDDFRKNYKTRTGVRFGVIEAVNKFTQDNNLEFFELPYYGWGIIKT